MIYQIEIKFLNIFLISQVVDADASSCCDWQSIFSISYFPRLKYSHNFVFVYILKHWCSKPKIKCSIAFNIAVIKLSEALNYAIISYRMHSWLDSSNEPAGIYGHCVGVEIMYIIVSAQWTWCLRTKFATHYLSFDQRDVSSNLMNSLRPGKYIFYIVSCCFIVTFYVLKFPAEPQTCIYNFYHSSKLIWYR